MWFKWKSIRFLNLLGASPRHTFTTRFMYTAIASTSYTPSSLDELHRGMAEDLNELFTSGLWVEAAQTTIYAACIGGKGDWPYIRKAFGLIPGYTSKRLCHLCPSVVPCMS